MKSFPFIAIILLFIPALTLAQKTPIKFGDVSKEELQMKVYEYDTSAPAVVLCDYGHFDGQTLRFTKTIRIKIFKKEGYTYANYAFPATSKSQVRGITFNLENGKITQEKLKNESIFFERVTEDIYNLRVAMPGIREGSVIDIQFDIPSFPTVWKFQYFIPVKYSELVIEWSQYIKFRTNFFGFERLSVSSPTRWVAERIPSFKEEPLMNSSENYITKLEIELLSILNHDFASTWERISKTLFEESDFGMSLTESGFLNQLSGSILKSGKSQDEMAVMACDSIKKRIRWNKVESLFPTGLNLAARYKMGSGTSSEINLILYLLLKKLDIQSDLVALSTRSNGIVSPVSTSIQKLNYVITRAKIGEKTYFLDATDPNLPVNLLPLRCLNYEGRLLNKNKSEIIDLTAQGKEKKVVMYDLSIGENNLVTGKMDVQQSEYSAAGFREKYSSFNSNDEFISDYKKDKPGLSIRQINVENINNCDIPVHVSFDVSINDNTKFTGDSYIFQPLFYDQIKENPLKSETRRYPVDLACKTENTVISTINIPQGYKISAMPASLNMKLEGGAATYLYNLVQDGSVLRLTSKLTINKTMFLPSECKELQEFYNQVLIKQAEPIIISKS